MKEFPRFKIDHFRCMSDRFELRLRLSAWSEHSLAEQGCLDEIKKHGCRLRVDPYTGPEGQLRFILIIPRDAVLPSVKSWLDTYVEMAPNVEEDLGLFFKGKTAPIDLVAQAEPVLLELVFEDLNGLVLEKL